MTVRSRCRSRSCASAAASPGRPEIRASTVGRASRLLVADVAPEHPGAVPLDGETPLFAGDRLVPAG